MNWWRRLIQNFDLPIVMLRIKLRISGALPTVIKTTSKLPKAVEIIVSQVQSQVSLLSRWNMRATQAIYLKLARAFMRGESRLRSKVLLLLHVTTQNKHICKQLWIRLLIILPFLQKLNGRIETRAGRAPPIPILTRNLALLYLLKQVSLIELSTKMWRINSPATN